MLLLKWRRPFLRSLVFVLNLKLLVALCSLYIYIIVLKCIKIDINQQQWQQQQNGDSILQLLCAGNVIINNNQIETKIKCKEKIASILLTWFISLLAQKKPRVATKSTITACVSPFSLQCGPQYFSNMVTTSKNCSDSLSSLRIF